jgi:hypothetical protein
MIEMKELEWLDDLSRLETMLLAELDATEQTLVAKLRKVEGGWALLRYLNDRPKAWKEDMSNLL